MSGAKGGKRVIAMAIDASEYAEYAFDWYVKYLHQPGNELVCIHVPEGFDIEKAQKQIGQGGQLKESMEKQYSKIQELEERYKTRMRVAGIVGSVISVSGKSPGAAILQGAHAAEAQAIVIGRRGLSQLKKLVLGSVSDYVLQHAECPVICVRKPGETAPEYLQDALF